MAIFLLGIIMTFIYSTYATSLSTKEAVEERIDVSRAGHQILSLLSRELESAYVTDQDAQGDFSRQPMTIFQGSRDTVGGNPMNRLLFTTLAHVYVPTGNPEDNDFQSDHAEVEYLWNQDLETNAVRLLHRENPALSFVPSQGGVTYELYDRVRSFQVRYWDGTAWVDEWDSTGRGPQALPYAVDIRFVLATERGAEYTFGALLPLPLAVANPALQGGPGAPGAPGAPGGAPRIPAGMPGTLPGAGTSPGPQPTLPQVFPVPRAPLPPAP